MFHAPGGDLWEGGATEPQEINIRLKDDTSLTMDCISCSTISIQGAIDNVDVIRPMHAVPFKEMKEDLIRTLTDLHFEPLSEIKQNMAGWLPDDEPGMEGGGIPATFSASTRTPFHGVILDVQAMPSPVRGWYYRISFGAVVPVNLPILSTPPQPSSPPKSDPRDVSLYFPGTKDQQRGIDLRLTNRGMEETDLLEPQNLTIHLASGIVAYFPARSVNLFFFDGVLRGLFARRPMEPVPYKQAKADLVQTLSTMKMVTDGELNAAFRKLPADAPDSGSDRRPYEELFSDEHIHIDLDYTIRMCPDPSGGWYYLLIIYDGVEATPLATTQPAK